MGSENVDSVLRGIASRRDHDEIKSSYSDVSAAMKHTGTPTNNILLSMIHSETRRNADETTSLRASVRKMELDIGNMVDNIANLVELIKIQNEIISSTMATNMGQSTPVSNRKQSSVGAEWYYQGTRLSSKYHAYACIISHLIDIVQIHIESMGKFYPDSVDCDFKLLQNTIGIVCKERCNIRSVEYRNPISVKDKDNQAFEMLYPHISSMDKNTPTVLSESMLSQICNPITRSIMQDIEWIRQRLCHIDGIMSPKQMDILKSIGNPIVTSETQDELNWNPKFITCRMSHPLAKDVAALPGLKKNEYVKLRLQGKPISEALKEAENYKK